MYVFHFKFRKKQNESKEDEQELSEIFVKTLTYTNRFTKFKNKETIQAIRQWVSEFLTILLILLSDNVLIVPYRTLLQKKLHKFEMAVLANLCPDNVEEAKALIPR